MVYIEIETAENSRLINWVRIYGDSNQDRAIGWADDLLSRVSPKPALRITDFDGKVTGAWQDKGYEVSA